MRTAKQSLPANRRPHLLLLETIELCRMPLSLRSRPTKGQTFYQLSLLPTYWQYKQSCLLIKKVTRTVNATNSSATKYKQSFVQRLLTVCSSVQQTPATSPLLLARQDYLSSCVTGWQLGHFRWVRTPRRTSQTQHERNRAALADGPNFIYNISRWADVTTLARLHAICRWSFGTLVTSRLRREITPQTMSRLPIPHVTNFEDFRLFHEKTKIALNERRELHRRLHIFQQSREVTDFDVLAYNSLHHTILQRITYKNYRWTYAPQLQPLSAQRVTTMKTELRSLQSTRFFKAGQVWYPTRRPLDILAYGKGIFYSQEAMLNATSASLIEHEYSNTSDFNPLRLRHFGLLKCFLTLIGQVSWVNGYLYPNTTTLQSPTSFCHPQSKNSATPSRLSWLWQLRNKAIRTDQTVTLPTKLLRMKAQLHQAKQASIAAAAVAKNKLFKRKPWLHLREARKLLKYIKKRKRQNVKRRKRKLKPTPLFLRPRKVFTPRKLILARRYEDRAEFTVDHYSKVLLSGYRDVSDVYSRVNNDRLDNDRLVYKHLVGKKTSAFRMFMLLANNFYAPHTK